MALTIVVWGLLSLILSALGIIGGCIPLVLRAAKWQWFDCLWTTIGEGLGVTNATEALVEERKIMESMEELPGDATRSCVINGGVMAKQLVPIPYEVIEDAIVHGLDVPHGHVRGPNAPAVLAMYAGPFVGVAAIPPIH